MTLQRNLAWRQIESTYHASVAHQFARYALELEYSSIPDRIVHQAKRCVIDTLGCAIGAYDAPGRAICEKTVEEFGGVPEATIFLSGKRTSAMNASLVNGFLVRFLDYNDFGGGGHNSDALPSLLAVAERERSTGRDFITSLVISYELGARFRDATSTSVASDESVIDSETWSRVSTAVMDDTKTKKSLEDLGWPSDIRGGLNQPPAIGRLMNLNEVQIANAIGICLSHSLPLGVLDGHRDECTMAKNIRFGWVAYDAVLSCGLAKNGFTGPILVVESDVGLKKVVARGSMDLERLTDFSGWRMEDVRFKSMPTNGPTATHVAATLALVLEHDLTPDDIVTVRVTTSVRESRHTTSPTKKYPRNAESADHSAHYANAHAIKERSFGPESINPSKFEDPVILTLIEKITVEAEPSFRSYQGMSEILTRDGRRLTKRIDVPRGLGRNAHTDAELECKFREMASKHMPTTQAESLLAMCWDLENLADLKSLTELMVVEG